MVILPEGWKDGDLDDNDSGAATRRLEPIKNNEDELLRKHKGDERFHDMEKIWAALKEKRKLSEQIDTERKQKAKMLETSWALIRLCKEIIKESKGDWIEMEEKNNMEKKKEEEKDEKKERIRKGKKKKELILEKETQQKLNVMFQELNDRNKSEWEKIIN